MTEFMTESDTNVIPFPSPNFGETESSRAHLYEVATRDTKHGYAVIITHVRSERVTDTRLFSGKRERAHWIHAFAESLAQSGSLIRSLDAADSFVS